MLNVFSLGYSVFIMNNCYCCTLTKGQPHTHTHTLSFFCLSMQQPQSGVGGVGGPY